MPMQTTRTRMRAATMREETAVHSIKTSIIMTSTTTKEHPLLVSNPDKVAKASAVAIQKKTPRPSATSP